MPKGKGVLFFGGGTPPSRAVDGFAAGGTDVPSRRGTVLFAGGGTGGHVFPALTVADRLRERRPGVRILFLGRADKIEAVLVPQAGYSFIPIRAAGLPRRPTWRWGPVLFALVRGAGEVWKILRRERPAVVFGTGGYQAGLVGGMAVLARVPLILHEANAVPGWANRWLARWAAEVHVGFAEAAERLPPGKARVSGNPVRRSIVEAAEQRRPRRPGEPLRVAVIGGSLGSATLNRAVVEALPELVRRPIRLIHQTGRAAYPQVAEQVRSVLAPGSCNIQVVPFVEEMGALYAQTDLLIARAGAMTITEAAWCGVPMVLVPLPHAGSDEQRQNAEAAARVGAALVVSDADWNGPRLIELVDRFLHSPELLEQMADRCRALARPDATDRLVDAIVARLPAGS